MASRPPTTGAPFPEDLPTSIARILIVRFGMLPPEITSALAVVTDPARLGELLDWAARCPSLNEFRDRLTAQGS